MDPDKLAERDRARRLRQLRKAKLQGLLLIGCMLLGLALALSFYFFGEPKKAPVREEKKPAAPSTLLDEASVKAPVTDASRDAAPPSAGPGADGEKHPAEPTAVKPAAVQTIRRTVPGTVRLDGKGPKAVPVDNVLASIGVTDSEKSMRPLPKVAEARRVLELLSKATVISAKMEHAIEKPGLEIRMREYYENRGLKDPEVGDQVADYEVQMAGDRYLDVIYKNPTRPAGTLRASFMRDAKGIVRLDWESFTGFSGMDMRAFREAKSAEPVTMRVYASADDYFNYEFSDPKKLLSVRLRNADGSAAVNGYCELGGRVATAFSARLAAEPGTSDEKRLWVPVIVKLRFPPKAQSDHCVELMDLMHGQWLAPAGLAE